MTDTAPTPMHNLADRPGLDPAAAEEVVTTLQLARAARVPSFWFPVALVGMVAAVGAILGLGALEQARFDAKFHLLREARAVPPTVEVQYRETYRLLLPTVRSADGAKQAPTQR